MPGLPKERPLKAFVGNGRFLQRVTEWPSCGYVVQTSATAGKLGVVLFASLGRREGVWGMARWMSLNFLRLARFPLNWPVLPGGLGLEGPLSTYNYDAADEKKTFPFYSSQ